MKNIMRTILFMSAVFLTCVNTSSPISQIDRVGATAGSGLLGFIVSIIGGVSIINYILDNEIVEQDNENLVFGLVPICLILANVIFVSSVYRHFSNTPENICLQVLDIFEKLSANYLISNNFENQNELLDYIKRSFKDEKSLVAAASYLNKTIKQLCKVIALLDSAWVDILEASPNSILYKEIEKITIGNADLMNSGCIDYLKEELKKGFGLSNKYLVLAEKIYDLRAKIKEISDGVTRKRIAIINSQGYKNETSQASYA